MAKALGFHPDTLIRNRPDPKQKWKLPVKEWVRELHFKRFGHLIGEETLPPAPCLDYDLEASGFGDEIPGWDCYSGTSVDRKRGRGNLSASNGDPEAGNVTSEWNNDDCPF